MVSLSWCRNAGISRATDAWTAWVWTIYQQAAKAAAGGIRAASYPAAHVGPGLSWLLFACEPWGTCLAPTAVPVWIKTKLLK